MGTKIKVTAEDGHQFDAYVAESSESPRAALIVLIQEIFGVNSHIRSVADGYAAQGFHVIAPALFDRVQRILNSTITLKRAKQGMGAITQIGMETAERCCRLHQSRQKPVARLESGSAGVLSGRKSWLARCHKARSGGSCLLLRRTIAKTRRNSACPVMMHFGAKDAHIGSEQIETIRKAHPEVPLFVYDAGHGFNCDQRKDYEPQSAALALSGLWISSAQYL